MTQETFPMIVGGEETLNERTLLTQVESGLMMNGADSVRFIVIHCSATQSDRDYTVEQLLRDHKVRGFRTIGYHFYIRRSGIVTQHRRLLEVGAHVRGLNRCSIGICYEGGLDESGKTTLFPHALIVGHRDLPGVKKACPCFSCDEYRYLFH